MLDDWQREALTESLYLRHDGRWSAFEVGVLVPRQNGKGGLLEARQLFGLFLGGEVLQVHTAHEFKTTFEHFLRITSLIENTPDLDAKVRRIRRGAGEQAIELMNGNRLRFLARTSASGRGLSGDTVYLDEAFALTPEIMGALLPTLSAVPNPQLWYTSSHPKAHQRVLMELVQRGRTGEGESRLLYFDWGNQAGVALEDREAWARANPALGIRITEDFIQAELEAMRSFPDEFLRERLGVVVTETASGVIPLAHWNDCTDKHSDAATGHASLVVGPQMAWAAMAYAGKRTDGLTHVEVVRHEAGTEWIVEACQRAHERTGNPVVVDPKSPTVGVLERLRAADVPLREVTTSDFVAACSALQADVLERRLRHQGQGILTAAVQGADIKPVGEAWAFSGRRSSVDITPLLAVTLAAIPVREAPTGRPFFFV